MAAGRGTELGLFALTMVTVFCSHPFCVRYRLTTGSTFVSVRKGSVCLKTSKRKKGSFRPVFYEEFGESETPKLLSGRVSVEAVINHKDKIEFRLKMLLR